MKGKVILVGAGPGNVGLMTLRGKAVLEQADVVVYDRLVSPEILSLIPPTTEQINVGKASSHHTLPQAEINLLLVTKAQEGKLVARLKGGDPFLFGRGGEEVAELQAHGIPFEIVSGISAGIAVPAFGGIPVTHRNYSSSLHLLTAHAKENQPLDLNFPALVSLQGTLVFFMGLSALPQLMEGLQQGGLPPKTPVSLIENGTSPRQRSFHSTAENISSLAVAEQVQSPALIIVGEVCGLAEELAWWEQGSLFGKKLLVTCATQGKGRLGELLRAEGAEVLDYPVIQRRPLANPLPPLEDFDCLCFTSPFGVDCVWKALRQEGKDARIFSGKKIAVVGQATAQALEQVGIVADWMPQTYDVAHLGDLLLEHQPQNTLILRAKEGAEGLTQALDKGGLSYVECPVYETDYIPPFPVNLAEFTALCFTSAATVTAFTSAVEGDLSQAVAICIGSQTASKAKEAGMKVYQAEKATLSSLVEKTVAVCNTNSNHSKF